MQFSIRIAGSFFKVFEVFFRKQTLHRLKNFNRTTRQPIKLIDMSGMKDLYYT